MIDDYRYHSGPTFFNPPEDPTMRSELRLPALAMGFAAATLAVQPAFADYRITCESSNSRYKSCPLSERGHVTLDRQLSSVRCTKGKTWDWNRREVWVDDGCRATFNVATDRYRDSDRKDDDNSGSAAAVAAGVLIGAAILGAVASNSDSDHVSDDRHADPAYLGGRHNSYVPEWMVGEFSGYNEKYNADVMLRIRDDGQVTATVNGRSVHGYISESRLYAGNQAFDIDRTRRGFVTSQVGDRSNQVRYKRVN